MRHILYIEDNQANIEVMQTFFKMHDHIELHFSETAELGMKKLASKQFDLILMDINLPGMDGQTLTEQLKKQQDFQYVPIIAITANAMQKDIENASEAFDAYITKPVDFVILTEELNRFL
jgi:CheY-like chemotaxis protein